MGEPRVGKGNFNLRRRIGKSEQRLQHAEEMRASNLPSRLKQEKGRRRAMANQVIKLDLLSSAQYSQAAMELRDLYVRLACLADDHGRLTGDRGTLRLMAYSVAHPTPAGMEDLLARLVEAGLITRYKWGGEPLIQLRIWQIPPRARRSHLPAPDSTGADHGAIPAQRVVPTERRGNSCASGSTKSGDGVIPAQRSVREGVVRTTREQVVFAAKQVPASSEVPAGLARARSSSAGDSNKAIPLAGVERIRITREPSIPPYSPPLSPTLPENAHAHDAACELFQVLVGSHPGPSGPMHRAVEEAVYILARHHDYEWPALIQRITAAHAAFVPHWRKRSSGPPWLATWFRDGEWEHPPALVSKDGSELLTDEQLTQLANNRRKR